MLTCDFVAVVKVTVVPVGSSKIKAGANSKACALSPENFKAFKIDTTFLRFDREEANAR